MKTGTRLPPVTVSRLALYLRCLRCLDELGIEKVSSKELAARFHLSAAQIRKDLAHIGGLGVRGVGYDVADLSTRLAEHLGLDRTHRVIIIGMGNLGRALNSYLAFGDGQFQVVGLFDNDPAKIGTTIHDMPVLHPRELADVVRRSRAKIAVLAVPEEVAQKNCEEAAAAGVRAVLNFAPTRLEPQAGVRVKDVDLRTYLEELGFFALQDEEATPEAEDGETRRLHPCIPCP